MAMISRKPHVIGKPFPLIEAEKKLTGASCYTDDKLLGPDTLHARILFSERPSARFRLRNLDAARNYPGVAALLSGQDISAHIGHTIADRELLATKQVRYVGQPLAIIAAETPEAAASALALIQVDYEDLPAVLSIDQALTAGSPLVHPHQRDYPGAEMLNADPERNIAHAISFSRGDTMQAFAKADVILERSYTAAHLQHAPLETHGGVAQQQPDGSITMWLHVQAPFLLRDSIAKSLHMDPAQIRIIIGCVGGSFGGKTFVSVEGLLAAIAMHTNGRPVRLLLSREEEFKCVFVSPAMQAHVKMGATKEGHINAIQATYHWDVGGSVDATLLHLQAAVLAGSGPYAIPNADISTDAIYTNLLPAAPLRGMGTAQVHWAIEQHVAELAEILGIDPLTLRQRNLVKGGDRLFPKFIMHANGLQSCGLQAVDAINWQPGAASQNESSPKISEKPGRGKGLAIGWSPIILSDQCGSRVTITFDAKNLCDVIVDGVDIGQGLYAFATQLVSFELNIPTEWITVQPVDTSNYDADWQATYHNLLWSIGHALLMSTADMKHQILTYMSGVWKEPIANLDIVEGEVISYATRRHFPLLDLLEQDANGASQSLSFRATATYRPPNTEGSIDSLVQSFAATAYAAEVQVDEATGGLNILQLAAAADVGHALNPESVKAQIKGAMIQSVSFTLLEEMIFENGVPLSTDFREYPIATTADMPQELHPIVVEVPQQSGPYGARDLSHHVQVGAAPAIANAIYRAVGVRVRDLPITAQRIYDALQEKKKREATNQAQDQA